METLYSNTIERFHSEKGMIENIIEITIADYMLTIIVLSRIRSRIKISMMMSMDYGRLEIIMEIVKSRLRPVHNLKTPIC